MHFINEINIPIWIKRIVKEWDYVEKLHLSLKMNAFIFISFVCLHKQVLFLSWIVKVSMEIFFFFFFFCGIEISVDHKIPSPAKYWRDITLLLDRSEMKLFDVKRRAKPDSHNLWHSKTFNTTKATRERVTNIWTTFHFDRLLVSSAGNRCETTTSCNTNITVISCHCHEKILNKWKETKLLMSVIFNSER